MSKSFWEKESLTSLKEGIRDADVNENKFVFNIDVNIVCLKIALYTNTIVAYINEKRQHIINYYIKSH